MMVAKGGGVNCAGVELDRIWTVEEVVLVLIIYETMAFVSALYRDFCIVTIVVVSFRSIEYIVVKKPVIVVN